MKRKDFNNITAASQFVEKGDLFIDYYKSGQDIYTAIKKGAKAIVTELQISKIPQNVIYFKIDDLKNDISSFLSELYDHPSKKLKIIGITGTNGKTSTTNFLFHVLNTLEYSVSIFSTVISKFKSKILTTPLHNAASVYVHGMLDQLVEKKCEYCCFETTSMALDTGHLNAVHFAGAIFTNLTHDHLDYHGSMENYLKAKKKLFDGLDENAFSLVNEDDSYSEKITAGCKAKKYTFSLQNPQADFYAELVYETIDGITLKIEGKEWQFPLLGQFNAYNLLGAYAAAVLLGGIKEKVLQALQNVEPPEGRLQSVKNNKGIHAFVDFAHTPDGLKKVMETINNIKSKAGSKVILVIGCGGNKDKEKRPVMGKIAIQNSNITIFTSDNPRGEDPLEIIKEMMYDLTEEEMQSLIIEIDRKAAIERACRLVTAGDILLVAGKGHENTQEIKNEKLHFSDREVLETALHTAFHLLDNEVINELYKKGEMPFGETPNKNYTEALPYINKGSVLDLGGGYGRFSLYFAKKGLEVINVDMSKEAIAAFNKEVKKIGLNALGLVNDITQFSFTKKYDNIICTTTLHLLNKEDAVQLLDNIKESTAQNGINFIAGFLKPHNDLFGKESLLGNDFLESYTNWEILYYKRFIGSTIDKRKLNAFILVAQKLTE